MSLHILKPADGVSPEIGYYLAGMDEVRQQLRETIESMSEDQLSCQGLPEAHPIGALMLHIAEAEWYWIQMVVSGHKLTDEDRASPIWDVLDDPAGFAAKGCSS